MPSFTPYGFGPVLGADDAPPALPPTPIPVGEAEAVLATLPGGIISARVVTTRQGGAATSAAVPSAGAPVRRPLDARRLSFEDVEARRSARGGLSCRVVLRRGHALASEADVLVEGEAESAGTMPAQSDEVAARAALDALARGEIGAASFALEGSAKVAAFGREFVLVGVVAR